MAFCQAVPVIISSCHRDMRVCAYELGVGIVASAYKQQRLIRFAPTKTGHAHIVMSVIKSSATPALTLSSLLLFSNWRVAKVRPFSAHIRTKGTYYGTRILSAEQCLEICQPTTAHCSNVIARCSWILLLVSNYTSNPTKCIGEEEDVI